MGSLFSKMQTENNITSSSTAISEQSQSTQDARPSSSICYPLPILYPASKRITRRILETCQKELYFQPFDDFLKVYPETVLDETIILDILNKENVGYFRHKDRHNTNFRVIIHGLSHDTRHQDLAKAINEKGYVVTKVLFQKHPRKKTCASLSSFEVDIVRIGHYRSIFTLKKILNTNVRVEPFRRTLQSVQCYACQKFGHTSYFCWMGSKCRFCALDDHPSRMCPTREDRSTHRCANCGGPHVSSSTTCPSRPLPKKWTQQQQQQQFYPYSLQHPHELYYRESFSRMY